MDDKNNLNKISGFSDRFSNELGISNKLDYEFFNFTKLWGYERIDTPIIEKSSIFSRKTGSSIGSNIYNFRDPSGLDVSLRPDFTPSIMRLFLENHNNSNEVRYSYSGEIYRYDSSNNKHYSRQNGVELIGNNNLFSDLEIIAMSKIFLEKILSEEIRISIGHLGILQEVIKSFELSDRVALFILQNIDQIRTNYSEDTIIIKAEESGIVFLEESFEIKEIQNQDFSLLLKSAFNSDSNFEQTRDKDSIISGMINKFSSSTSREKFLQCVSIINKLVNINLNLEESISEANLVLKNISVKNKLKNLYDLTSNLSHYDIDQSEIFIDYGLVREWGYYTGFVFNLTNSNNDILGGGGRYDSVGNSLGEKLSAAGFAIDSEKIIHSKNFSFEVPKSKKIIIYIDDQNDLNEAIDACKKERSKGNIVSLNSSFANLEELKLWSSRNEISEVIFFENNNINRSKI